MIGYNRLSRNALFLNGHNSMIDNLPQQAAAMVAFTRVVEMKSFSAAAEVLGLSKSAVSKQVARLESLVGARLLRRTTRSLSLTQAGEVMYERAAQAVALLTQASGALSELTREPRGRVRITAPVTYGRLRVLPRLQDFLARYPNIEVQLVLLDRAVDLAAEGFDFAIRLTPKLPADVVARPLGKESYTLVAKSGYFERRSAPQQPADLQHVNCLLYEMTDALSTWHLVGPSGNVKVRVSGNMAVNSSESLHQLVLRGVGVAVLPSWVADSDLRRGRLEQVLPGWRVKAPFATDVHLVWLPNRHLTVGMRSFIDFMAARRS
jgi:DNA-binding transcriptional LysR family regulator